MRYCPRCRHFNPGKPPICHFCGATWYVRLCPRGHENPPSAQYCGTCGSTDLSETAGRRPWFLIAFKLSLWLLAGLFIYSLVSGVGNISVDQILQGLISITLVPCILLLALWLALSLLPKPVGQSVRKPVKYGLRLLGLAAWGLLKLIWRILK
ncbi:MAG: hypothetical protein A4E62_00392 [Syntrophorhabdus sp. PtaU1.Bin002]|nr:MAG: hypothetical protein A4E62_00392 [Syntrophorhabdus sp. PtaU1.Bin002]